MKAVVEPLEGNRVKVSVEVDETEFERDLDAAFRRISREVRLPGFRPGKAPRRLLEAKLGKDVGREEALREALPTYYSQAVRDNDVDVIAAPEIEITAGKDEGPLTFDAIVEVRPVISIDGYDELRVEIPRPEASEEEIDAQIDRLRDQFGELTAVDRPAIDGDHATITINGSRDGEDIAGLQADDYLYEVGSGSIASELDEHLRGSKVGDILSFDAQPADPDEDLVQFRVIVKDVKQKVLPDVTDEWANDVSEFDTVEELRGDLASRITRVRKLQAQMASRDKAAVALADLVHDDPPEAMVNAEMQQRLQDLGMRLSAQGITAEQYLQATGQTQEQLGDELRQLAAQAVKVDLGLRAVADAEAIEATDEELDEEFARVAERLDQDPDKVRQEFERAEQVPAVRSDIRKRKALDWLVEHVELVDEHGQPVDRQALELDELEAQTDDDHDIEVGEIEVDDVEAGDETAEQDPP
ncbi:MAG TPA: trigger factor [Acidimicrobiales bacterium]|nr:trigger factor [Acidimicrobiales bacterium]